jgi:hypothetical protein
MQRDMSDELSEWQQMQLIFFLQMWNSVYITRIDGSLKVRLTPPIFGDERICFIIKRKVNIISVKII